jgi:hypothetical protein
MVLFYPHPSVIAKNWDKQSAALKRRAPFQPAYTSWILYYSGNHAEALESLSSAESAEGEFTGNYLRSRILAEVGEYDEAS